MSDTKKNRTLKEKLTNRYRLVVMNEDTLEEVGMFNLSRLNIYLLFSFSAALLTAAIVALIIFTPIKEYLPGYEGVRLRKELITLKMQLDSIGVSLEQRTHYYNSLRFALTDGRDSSFLEKDRLDGEFDSIELSDISELDYDFRAKVEKDIKYRVFADEQANDLLHFIDPVYGLVSEAYDPNSFHFGVDVVAPEKTVIKACYDGVVCMNEFTIENGYVVGIQHPNEYISFYKHNSQLLKKSGNIVKAGDPIAIIGSTGTNSTGVHLHFELWHKGEMIDPCEYFDFK